VTEAFSQRQKLGFKREPKRLISQHPSTITNQHLHRPLCTATRPEQHINTLTTIFLGVTQCFLAPTEFGGGEPARLGSAPPGWRPSGGRANPPNWPTETHSGGEVLGTFLLEVAQKTPIFSRFARKDVQRRQHRSNSSKNLQMRSERENLFGLFAPHSRWHLLEGGGGFPRMARPNRKHCNLLTYGTPQRHADTVSEQVNCGFGYLINAHEFPVISPKIPIQKSTNVSVSQPHNCNPKWLCWDWKNDTSLRTRNIINN
jgi:hypothetical protein